MKKIIIVLGIIAAIYVLGGKSQTLIIPDDAIRFRVIASSNTPKDQEIKLKVKNNLSNELALITQDATSINNTRKSIVNNMDNIKANIENTLSSNNYSGQYDINYGLNYFPKKEYKGTIYNAGEYESLVVTLGKGEGANWWCVLFPPLCSLEAESNNSNKVEYQLFVKKIIDKFSK